MNIVYVFADTPQEWNCSEWRCAVPARALNRSARHHAELLSIDEFRHNTAQAEAVCTQAEVIVVQRNLFGPVLSTMQHWKAREKAIVVDFDDAYPLMPTSNPNYMFWSQGIVRRTGEPDQRIDPLPLVQFKWGLRLAHGATVPSKRLADDWHSFADLYYLPNYIELKPYENVTRQSHEGIIIGWGGSASHLQSLCESGVMAALKRVCRARPQVKVMICGNDTRILNALPVPTQQKLHQPWTPYAEWGKALVQFDIGLAPLYGAYDERRSWIKVLEYMVMKIPWVATEGPAYQDFDSYGWLVKNTPGSWERILLDMVDHIDDYRARAAGEPYLFGISQNIDENIDRMVEIYDTISRKAFGYSDSYVANAAFARPIST